MNKLTLTVPQDNWSGLKTKYAFDHPLVSSDNFLANSKNFDTVADGAITKIAGTVAYNPTALPTPANDQFEAIFSSGVHHLLVMEHGNLRYSTGGGVFTLVRSGYSTLGNMEFALYQDRVYFGNGIDNPQVYDLTAAYGGAFAVPVTITIVSFAGLAGDTIKIGSTTLTEGADWTAATSNTATATSLKNALNLVSGVTATSVGAVVTVISNTPHTVISSDLTNAALASVSAPRVKDMGCQVPGSAPTAPATGSGAAGSVPDGAHTYKVTFLYYDQEESNGSAASTVCTVTAPASTVALTAVPIGPYGVTVRKIYRDNNDGSWLLVGQISNNTGTTFSDTASVGTAAIPTRNNLPPLFSLVVLNKDRLFLGGVVSAPSVVYYTDAGHPNIVNLNNFLLADQEQPITGLAVYNDRPIVLNRKSLGQVLGTTQLTYQYGRIPSAIGCVDNRSIQVLTSKGVPRLAWLSDKGFYSFNGYSVDYISDDIEDQINFNIQQAQPVKGRNTQSTDADFNAGTSSLGIVVGGGEISVINPQSVYGVPSAFEAGTLTALVTKAADGSIKVPTLFAPTYADGVFSGSVALSGSNLSLPSVANSAGETQTRTSEFITAGSPLAFPTSYRFYQQILQVRSGTISSVGIVARFFRLQSNSDTALNCTVSVYTDLFGSPGSAISSGNVSVACDGAFHTISVSLSAPISGGTPYWLVLSVPVSTNMDVRFGLASSAWTTSTPAYYDATSAAPGLAKPKTALASAMAGTYVFAQTPVASSGQWTSPVYDSGLFAQSATMAMIAGAVANLPASTGSITYVDQSDSSDMASPTTQTVTNLNGTQSLTFATKRFWRLRVTLTTSDDRNVPVVQPTTLKFPTQSIWISETIDCKDVTAYNTLSKVEVVPAGTSDTLQIATSDDDITYTAYGTLGGATVKRYAKLKLVLNATSDDITTPTVSSVTFTWTNVSTFTSSAIDTGITPPGWELFSATYTLNGGTIAFYVRTAASSGGLGAASYTVVTPGTYIPSALNEFIQWKAVITSTAAHVPLIDDVTVNWFINAAKPSIRVASLFFNRTYYLAVAAYGSTYNNLVYKYDYNGVWKRDEDLNINTFSFFFNAPYCGLSTVGTIAQFGQGVTNLGAAITMDARVALKFGARVASDMEDKTKRLREVTAVVKGTGASYQFYYSVDGGVTWTLMRDVNTGLTTFTPAADSARYLVRVAPVSTDGQAGAYGKHMLLRVVDSSLFGAEVRSIKARVWLLEQSVMTSQG